MLTRHSLAAVVLIAVVGIGATVAGARPVAAGESYLRGVDVSHWQGQPAWATVKNSGITFVLAKASNANTARDPEYLRNRKKLRKLGVAFAAYHHSKPDTSVGDALAEANNFLAVAGLQGNDLLPVLEFKSDGGLTPEQLTEWAKTWLARVEERLGVKSMIYASPALWVEGFGDTTWFADNGHRLWVRNWNVATPTVPAGNWGGHGWTLWQYGKAAVPGIKGKVDVNYFNGSDLAALRIKNN